MALPLPPKVDEILGVLLNGEDLHLVGGALYAQSRLSDESNDSLESLAMLTWAGGNDPSFATAWHKAKLLRNAHAKLSAGSGQAKRALYIDACKLELKQSVLNWVAAHPKGSKEELLKETQRQLVVFRDKISPLFPPVKGPARPRHLGKYSRRATRQEGRGTATSTSLLDSIERASVKRSQEIRDGKGEVFVRFDPTQYLDPKLYQKEERERSWEKWDEERLAEGADQDDAPWRQWDAQREQEAAAPPPVVDARPLKTSIDQAVKDVVAEANAAALTPTTASTEDHDATDPTASVVSPPVLSEHDDDDEADRHASYDSDRYTSVEIDVTPQKLHDTEHHESPYEYAGALPPLRGRESSAAAASAQAEERSEEDVRRASEILMSAITSPPPAGSQAGGDTPATGTAADAAAGRKPVHMPRRSTSGGRRAAPPVPPSSTTSTPAGQGGRRSSRKLPAAPTSPPVRSPAPKPPAPKKDQDDGTDETFI
eukprot:m.13814 g.13814  ORF g.13814 m.13814 type:complete len:485 (+) comp3090_c0_seq1:220-1674(+)